MSGKSRIVWFVETGSSACCDQNSFRMDHIGSFFHDGKTDSSVDSSIFRKKICDVYVVENIYVFTFIYGIRGYENGSVSYSPTTGYYAYAYDRFSLELRYPFLLGNTTIYGDIYSFLVRTGGSPRRYDGKGIAAIIESYAA